MKTPFRLFLFFFLFSQACSSGKKAFDKGQYDSSVMISVNRLRQDPGNKKAIVVLRNAYPLAQKRHLERINNLKNDPDVYRWERIAQEYYQLNALYQEIQNCPSCLLIISNVANYPSEQNEAKLKAAEVRYALGDQAIQRKSREAAREAYEHYSIANDYYPAFKEVVSKMKEAKFLATLKVVVDQIPIHSQMLSLSNEFFQNKIVEYLHNMPAGEFVRFYSPDEAKSVGLTAPDHLIRLRFDDFIVGQAFVKETIEEVSRDSVVISKIKNDKGENVNVYGTVKAKVHRIRKTLTSNGLLDFRVIDPNSNQVISQEKFPGTFVWSSEWGFFNGDERALNKADLEMIKRKEAIPPPPQTLFIEFTKPIFSQLSEKIRAYYRGYL